MGIVIFLLKNLVERAADMDIGMLVLALGITAVCAYLLGSLNFAILVSRSIFKEDVRTKGSGNAGMTNILRSYGKKGAILTLLGDVLKGILAVWIGRLAILLLVPGVDMIYGAYIGGIVVILGHMFPLYFGFKGGKGVATSGGVIIALQPLLAAILLLVFLLVLKISKMVSLGSVVGISLYGPVTLVYSLLLNRPVVYSTVCSVIISLLVVWMHRGNIKRIAAGTEYKFGSKKAEQTPPCEPPQQAKQ